ncbi:MAG: DUF3631 domain-containing protein [Paracoccaceae bacterium]
MTWDVAKDMKDIAEGGSLDPDIKPDAEAAAKRLAELTELEYESVREAEAKALGVRVSALDDAVKRYRKRSGEAEAAPFSAVEPWPDPVQGSALLDSFVETFRRYCVLPDRAAEALALWCLFAHCHEAAGISPILALTSPEKRCGKTTTISVVSVLVPKPMHTINVTPSVLFRVVEMFGPTVLIDEGDTFLKDNEDMRGLLNGGHNRLSAFVWRATGDEHAPRQFKVWSPKAIAMIGRLPDTLEDRSISVPLRRRRVGETVERFRADNLSNFVPLVRQAARWGEDNLSVLRDAEPLLPVELSDRGQDNWRTLIAIADLAGGHWPQTARAAAVALADVAANEDAASPGVQLLRDLREIIGSWLEISSTDLVARLIELEDGPWREWRHGKPISTRGVSTLLKPFGVRPYRGKGNSRYRRHDLEDAWTRYLADGSPDHSEE